jgi:hypothetical protein
MKSFKEYLTESKKVYEFKVKLIGECPKDCSSQIKAALGQFHVGSVSAGKSTPIQEHHSDFPEHKNVRMTVFDITTDYPATSHQIRDMIASGLGKSLAEVKALSKAEAEEIELNHAHDKSSGKALLGTDYEASNHQDLVGEKHTMKFLQELNKDKHQGTQYKGYNDELLATSVPGQAPEYKKVKDANKEKPSKSPVAKHPADPIKGIR